MGTPCLESPLCSCLGCLPKRNKHYGRTKDREVYSNSLLNLLTTLTQGNKKISEMKNSLFSELSFLE